MKKKVVVEEDGYYVAMDIDEDRKRVKIIIVSTQEMEDGDIVLAIEDWLHNNLLDGFQNISDGEH